MTTSLRRVCAVATALLALALITAAPAWAHVTVDTAEPAGGGAAVVTFSFDHACADSPTTSLETRLPTGAAVRSVTPPDGWRDDVDGDTVTMTGPTISGDRQVEYSITAELTGQVGQALLFPTVQTCASGETLNWTDADESANEPAPRLIATAAILARITPLPGAAADTNEGASTIAVVVSLVVFIALAAGFAFSCSRHTKGHTTSPTGRPQLSDAAGERDSGP